MSVRSPEELLVALARQVTFLWMPRMEAGGWREKEEMARSILNLGRDGSGGEMQSSLVEQVAAGEQQSQSLQ